VRYCLKPGEKYDHVITDPGPDRHYHDRRQKPGRTGKPVYRLKPELHYEVIYKPVFLSGIKPLPYYRNGYYGGNGREKEYRFKKVLEFNFLVYGHSEKQGKTYADRNYAEYLYYGIAYGCPEKRIIEKYILIVLEPHELGRMHNVILRKRPEERNEYRSQLKYEEHNSRKGYEQIRYLLLVQLLQKRFFFH
jgi:hypothetical protein